MPRGTSIEYVADCNGIDITNVLWKDNKSVHLVSSFLGINPEEYVSRFDRKLKEKVRIKCPAIIKQYNRHMGGVDLLDSLIGRYKISMRSRKWYMRLFYHLIDVTIINAWLLYKKSCNSNMKLVDFRLDIAQTLCISGTNSTKRGRPSLSQVEIDVKKKKGNAAPIPPVDVRLDETNHFPTWNGSRVRCKMPKCNSQTYVTCAKCSIALCFNQNKNCFREFHTK